MSKKREILIILMNLILIIFLISSTVFGTLIDEFESSIDTSGSTELKDTGATILGVIRVIGTIIAVAMIMILGVKYMMGSADQKAEYRKSMLPYFVGAILLFAATNLTDAIYNWAKGL